MAVLTGSLFLIATAFGWQAGRDSLAIILPWEGWVLTSFAIGLGLTGVGVAILAVSGPWLPAASDDPLSIETERGVIRIPGRTVVEYLEREAIRLAGINSLRVRLVRHDRKISLDLDALVTADRPIPDIAGDLQEFVKKELKQTLGIEEVEGIHVRIKKIAPDMKPVLLPQSNEREKASS
jgi:uncharacterized alkaline shock family protein YloU